MSTYQDFTGGKPVDKEKILHLLDCVGPDVFVDLFVLGEFEREIIRQKAEIAQLKTQLAAAVNSLIISTENLAECSAEIAEMRAALDRVCYLYTDYFEEDGGDLLEREVRLHLKNALGSYAEKVAE